MDISEAVRLTSRYVYDRKRERVNLNVLYIASDTRQQEMLKEAVRIAVEYYNGTKIVV